MDNKEIDTKNTELFWHKKTILYYILAISVFLIHCSSLAQYYSYNKKLELVNDFISQKLCVVAVPMFFFLSGFLFFRNYKSKDYLKKLKKRSKTLLVVDINWWRFERDITYRKYHKELRW